MAGGVPLWDAEAEIESDGAETGAQRVNRAFADTPQDAQIIGLQLDELSNQFHTLPFKSAGGSIRARIGAEEVSHTIVEITRAPVLKQ